jgi:hypothetical protein
MSGETEESVSGWTATTRRPACHNQTSTAPLSPLLLFMIRALGPAAGRVSGAERSRCERSLRASPDKEAAYGFLVAIDLEPPLVDLARD